MCAEEKDADDQTTRDENPPEQSYAKGYSIDDFVDVQFYDSERGYWEWSPAQVVGLGKDGRIIRVRELDERNMPDEVPSRRILRYLMPEFVSLL